jgi:hypothetical protein
MSESEDRRSAGRKNPPVIASLSRSVLEQTWKDAQKQLGAPNVLGCHLWKGSTQNGYPSISQGHGKSKIKVHMLAVFMARDELPSEKQVCSHLCHRKRCCNPDHIVIEGIVENSRRNNCLHSLVAGGQTWNLCPHTPRCLRRDTDNLGDFEPSVCGPTPTA